MPVTEKWAEEAQHVLIIEVTGHWDWDEFFKAIERSQVMGASVNHTEDVIIDWTSTNYTPPKPIVQLPRLAEAYQRTQGILVLAGITSILGKITAQVFSRVYGQVHYAETRAEALAIIARRHAE